MMPIGNRLKRMPQVLLHGSSAVAEGRAPHPATARAKPVWALIIPWEPSDGGGVNQVVLNLAAELRRQGRYEPVVIVLDWQKAGAVELRDGIRHLFIRLRDPIVSELGPLTRLRYDLLAWWEAHRFRRLLRRLGARVVNFHYPTPAAEYLVRSRQCARTKILFSLHGLDIVEASRKPPAVRARYLRMLAAGNAVIAVSDGFASLVTRELAPELAGIVRVIRNGVAPLRLWADQPLDVALPARYILNVATFEAKKGQRFLIEAFGRLAAADPDLHLVIAGRPEGTYQAITQQVRRLGLEQRVLLLGDVPHDRIGKLYASASLFCLSSLAEPFGIVLLEAGLFGLPVVATRVGGVPEIISDGVNGILVPPGDSTALAGAVRRLLDRPAEAAALAANLCDRVLSEFQWSASVARYMAVAEEPAERG
jgi:glycosyltransferase involved in cell wall biosynthesis